MQLLANSPTRDVPKLINLNELVLENIDLPWEYQHDAIKRSLQKAVKEELAGFLLSYKAGKKTATIRIICLEKTGIPKDHPQVVKKLSNGYYVMKNQIAV